MITSRKWSNSPIENQHFLQKLGTFKTNHLVKDPIIKKKGVLEKISYQPYALLHVLTIFF